MRKSTLLLSCVSVATTAMAVWLWQQRPDETSANVPSSGLPDIPECEREPEAAPVMSRTSNASAASAATVAKSRTESPRPPVLPPGFVPVSEPQLMKDPEFRVALRGQQRVHFEQQYRDLPRILGLSSGQADRLFDMLAEQGVRAFDARWEKPEKSRTPADAYQEARAKNDAELASFLGASNMIRFQEFRSTLESRAEVNSVRNELAAGAEPLRQDQFDPLLAVVIPELQRLNQEVRDLPQRGMLGADPAVDARRVELTVAANQRILDGARSILSGAQQAGLADLYRRQRLQMENEGTMNRLRFAAMSDPARDLAPR